MISINIAAIHGKYLNEVLESITTQNYDKYEIIIVNAGGNSYVSKLAKDYSAKEIGVGGSLLKARYASLTESKGHYAFNLDETRPLSRPDALEILSRHKSDIVFINETEIVTNNISKAAELDREMIFSEKNIASLKPYVLPRFYNAAINLKAIEEVKNKLGNLYDQATILPEDLLIYNEARKLSNSVSIEFTPLMRHYGDYTVRDVIRKYYRYGKGFAFTSLSSYRDLGRISVGERLKGRIDTARNFKELVLLCTLLGIRGTSGLLGETTERMRIAIKQNRNVRR